MPVFTASINVCNLILIKIYLHSCLGINHFRNTRKAKNAFTEKSDTYTKISSLYLTAEPLLKNAIQRWILSTVRANYYTLGKWKRNRYWRNKPTLMIVMNLPQNQLSSLLQLNFLALHFHQLKWIAIVVHHKPTHRLDKLGPSAVGWLVWIIHARIGELGEALTPERREVWSGGGEDGRLMTQPSRASELSTYHNCRQGYATKKALKVTGSNSCCWWRQNVEQRMREECGGRGGEKCFLNCQTELHCFIRSSSSAALVCNHVARQLSLERRLLSLCQSSAC